MGQRGPPACSGCRAALGAVLGLSWACLGPVLGLFWVCPGSVLASWVCQADSEKQILTSNKCHWTSVEWKWKDGIAELEKYDSKTAAERGVVDTRVQLTNTEDNTRSIIKRLGPNEAYRTLGAHVCVTGRQNGQLKVIAGKVNQWSYKVTSGPPPRFPELSLRPSRNGRRPAPGPPPRSPQPPLGPRWTGRPPPLQTPLLQINLF